MFGIQFQKLKELMTTYIPPCDQMNIIYRENKVKANAEVPPQTFQVKIQYEDKTYQEIKNSRGFNFENVWAGIGGFVGIFVGVSLMQIPGLFFEGFKKSRNMAKKLNLF